MGKMKRRMKRQNPPEGVKHADVPTRKQEDGTIVQACPVCFGFDFLRSPLTDPMNVVKCAGCGAMFDPTIRELVKLIQDRDKSRVDEEEETKDRTGKAMSREDFETLREKYKEGLIIKP